MGKQWLLYKGSAKSSSTGKSRKRGGGGGLSSSGGCMGAIFHLFDHHHFPFHQPSSSSFISHSSSLQQHNLNHLLLNAKGVEAPRNSLEVEGQESMVVQQVASSSPQLKQETNFNIPIHIKTKTSRFTDDECSTSPSTKTPNLVARLMGLDLLPENSSPRPSSSSSTPLFINPLSNLSNSHKIKTNTCCSLPTTPRVSTTSRPSTEIDYRHRLSLQTNKENKRPIRDSEYAKQIAEQVRENIKRRVGVDITNTLNNKDKRRDECLVVLKPKTSPSNEFNQGYAHAKEIEACSPRLRLLEIKNILKKPISNSPKLSSSAALNVDVCMKADPSSSTVVKSPRPLMKKECKKKKIASEKYDVRLKKMHKQEEAFVKKCNKQNKSTPLSNHLNTTTKFISFKKDMPSSSTKLRPKQVPLKSITQLPSCQSRSYNTKETNRLSVQDYFSGNGNGNDNDVAAVTTTGDSVSDHFDYISRILGHMGIEKTTKISITHWYSPSHPLHPTLFQQLEKLYHPSATNLGNRKLIFEVVDEVLAEILKPYISLKPWGVKFHGRMEGMELIRKLCQKMESFPAADCRVLEDIDGLIEGDMVVGGGYDYEEEAEEVVREVVDTLVDEMAGSWV